MSSRVSLSQHQWNSTSGSVDPWSITSQNVHMQLKSQKSTQDILLSNIQQWSNEWKTSSDYPLTKGKAPTTLQSHHDQKPYQSKENDQYIFHELAPGQGWDFAHQQAHKKKDIIITSHIESELVQQSRYKTELCRSWSETGSCRYGGKCQFAHGEGELRPILRHPKYKTELCRSWSETGQCPYGNRCRFIHNEPITSDDSMQSKDPMMDMNLLSGSFSQMSIHEDESKYLSKSNPLMSQTQEEMLLGLEDLQKEEKPKKQPRLPFFKGLVYKERN